MSLKKNIENAFLKTIGYDDIEDRESKSLMKEKYVHLTEIPELLFCI